MTITCIRCGADRFKAGEVQPAPQGGFFLIMPCSECDTANVVLHEQDEEFAKTLLEFFGATT
jgi:aspartate/methionine/tyrosine aminotransferase